MFNDIIVFFNIRRIPPFDCPPGGEKISLVYSNLTEGDPSASPRDDTALQVDWGKRRRFENEILNKRDFSVESPPLPFYIPLCTCNPERNEGSPGKPTSTLFGVETQEISPTPDITRDIRL
jgi:hypothetical protein